MITAAADRFTIDVAFQPRGTWRESAAQAHEFAAALHRAFAEQPALSYIGTIAVEENESYHFVRIVSDEVNYPRCERLVRALAGPAGRYGPDGLARAPAPPRRT
jgi:hypothetical protein